MKLPELNGMVSLDIETYDPNLETAGPGDIRQDGFIAGVGLAMNGWSAYYPLRHEQGWNLENEDAFYAWLREQLLKPQIEVVLTNAQYDLGWLASKDISVAGRLHDIQIAEPLLDENQFSYSLDSISRRRLGHGKPEDALYEWLAEHCGGAPSRRKQAKNIWRAPAEIVTPYAIGDVELPLKILAQQRKEMHEQGLDYVYDIECNLIKPLLAMRRRGVRVDVEKAERVGEELRRKENTARDRLGVDSVWAAKQLANVYDKEGIKYPHTAKGAPSFTALWLSKRAEAGCTVSRDVLQVRQAEKARGTFIDGYVLGHAVNGRIHAQFHQMKSDEGGTVTGRFSSSGPNLQNIPARDPELGPLIRGLFYPDEGEEWVSHDWSQVEYRLLTHYGRGPSADAAREAYRTDPTTDFHQFTADLTGLDRKPAKNVNFGLVYGMGKKKLANDLGLSPEDAEEIFTIYHTKQAFVRQFSRDAGRAAARRGWVKTIAGRRRRFNFWEPRDWELSRHVRPTSSREDAVELAREAAEELEEDGKRFRKGVKRAYTHKSANSIIQGGAADFMKKAMSDIHDSGVCDVLGPMLLTVHDELGWSRPRTKEGQEAIAHARQLMINVWPALRVPLMVDEERGEHWGALEEV